MSSQYFGERVYPLHLKSSRLCPVSSPVIWHCAPASLWLSPMNPRLEHAGPRMLNFMKSSNVGSLSLCRSLESLLSIGWKYRRVSSPPPFLSHAAFAWFFIGHARQYNSVLLSHRPLQPCRMRFGVPWSRSRTLRGPSSKTCSAVIDDIVVLAHAIYSIHPRSFFGQGRSTRCLGSKFRASFAMKNPLIFSRLLPPLVSSVHPGLSQRVFQPLR